MTVLRALARPMLASIFIVQGYSTLRQPERVASKAEPVVRLLAERVPAVPAKAERLGYSFRYPRLENALSAIFRG